MASANVVNGVGGGAFDPNGQLIRQETAAMFFRLSDALGKLLANSEPTFADNSSIASSASVAMNGT